MAVKKSRERTDYGALVKNLKEGGPRRLYFLYGEEDYLRERFFEELKSSCLGNDGADFNHHRLKGEKLDISALEQAIDSMPFMGERCLVEIRDFSVGEFREEQTEKLKLALGDIPDYTTVVLLAPAGTEPDGRLSLTRFLKKQGEAIEFTTQSQNQLSGWVRRRFASLGKEIGPMAIDRLIFLSGSLMAGLIPEIEKIAGFVPGKEVTAEDVEALALHIPEARVFEMTDCLARKQYDGAAALLAELLASGEHPVKTLALIGFQFRRLYAGRVALDTGRGAEYIRELYGMSPYAADRLMDAARGFSAKSLQRALELCAESDFRMKSSSAEDEDILKELLLALAVEDVK